MWHGDDCRVGLTDSCQKLSERERHCDGYAIEPLLEFKNEIIDVYAAVFVSLMTYAGVRRSSLARCCQGFATDEAANRLSLRHNVKKEYVCVLDTHFSYTARLRYN